MKKWLLLLGFLLIFGIIYFYLPKMFSLAPERHKEVIELVQSALDKKNYDYKGQYNIVFERTIEQKFLNFSKKETAVAFPLLEEALKNEDPYTRMFALRIFRKLARFASRFVPALLEILKTDSDFSVRSDAAEALGLIAWHNKIPLSELEIGLQDKDGFVRVSTIKGLAFMKQFATHALPKLEQLAKTDPEGDVRAEAQGAIEAIRSEISQ